MDYSILFVCLMGIATVFIGLICIIVLVSVMSSIVGKTDKAMAGKKGREIAPASAEPVKAVPSAGSEVTPELIAVISACIAEELKADVNALRIVSCRKV